MAVINDKQTLDDTFTMRVNSIVNKEFQKKSIEHGKSPAEFMRELMKAFNEGRLNIQLTEAQKKQLKGTYNVD